MKNPSWVCTLAVQLTLCLALYGALRLGQPQKLICQVGVGSFNVYFISVTGGFRASRQQTRLLKLMENVAKAYKAEFVLDITELGEDDPLMQNATELFRSLEIPWFATRASKGREAGYFIEQIELPSGNSLDIIGIDTGKLVDSTLMESSRGTNNSQLNWLTRTLGATDANWRVVVGFDPLFSCKHNAEQTRGNQVNQLHQIFLKFGVNAYLSKQGCTNYARLDAVSYIGNPGPVEEFYTAPITGISAFKQEMANGFLLHRVSSLEIVTHFVNSDGEVMCRTRVQQRGREVM